MPLYEYACIKCSHSFDIRHGANETPELSCPECSGSVKKVFHAAGVIFKGSGWYITDSAPKKNNIETEKKADTESSSSPVSKETTPTPSPV